MCVCTHEYMEILKLTLPPAKYFQACMIARPYSDMAMDNKVKHRTLNTSCINISIIIAFVICM